MLGSSAGSRDFHRVEPPSLPRAGSATSVWADSGSHVDSEPLTSVGSVLAVTTDADAGLPPSFSKRALGASPAPPCPSAPMPLAAEAATRELDMVSRVMGSRIRTLERNVSNLVLGDPSVEGRADTLRSEVAQIVQQETNSLREQLARELQDAVRAGEARLEAAATAAVVATQRGLGADAFGKGSSASYSSSFGQQSTAWPDSVSSKFAALEHRFERQASSMVSLSDHMQAVDDKLRMGSLGNTFSMDRVAAAERTLEQRLSAFDAEWCCRRQEWEREMTKRFDEYDVKAAEERENLAMSIHKALVAAEGNFHSELESLRNTVRAPSANSTPDSEQLSKEIAGAYDSIRALGERFDGQLKAERAAVEDIIVRYQEVSASQICSTWDVSCNKMKTDVHRIVHDRHASIESQLKGDAAALKELGARMRSLEDELSKQCKLDTKTEAQNLANLAATLRTEFLQVQDTDPLNGAAGAVSCATSSTRRSHSVSSSSCTAAALEDLRAHVCHVEAKLREEFTSQLSVLEHAPRCQEAGGIDQASDLAKKHALLEDVVASLTEQVRRVEQQVDRDLPSMKDQVFVQMQKDLEPLSSLVSQSEELVARVAQKCDEARQRDVADVRHELQELHGKLNRACLDRLALDHGDLSHRLEELGMQCQSFADQMRADQDARCEGMAELRKDLMEELHDLDLTCEKKTAALSASVTQEIVRIRQHVMGSPSGGQTGAVAASLVAAAGEKSADASPQQVEGALLKEMVGQRAELATLRAAMDEYQKQSNTFRVEAQDLHAAVQATSSLVKQLREDAAQRRGASPAAARPREVQLLTSVVEGMQAQSAGLAQDLQNERRCRETAIEELRHRIAEPQSEPTRSAVPGAAGLPLNDSGHQERRLADISAMLDTVAASCRNLTLDLSDERHERSGAVASVRSEIAKDRVVSEEAAEQCRRSILVSEERAAAQISDVSAAMDGLRVSYASIEQLYRSEQEARASIIVDLRSEFSRRLDEWDARGARALPSSVPELRHQPGSRIPSGSPPRTQSGSPLRPAQAFSPHHLPQSEQSLRNARPPAHAEPRLRSLDHPAQPLRS